MKGLWKHLSPFAPDQSGATAVLCEMGGLIVIIDAGGCAGNICGFDEPRWFEKKSAIFSAGLRDMDAILGRDDRLVMKIQKVCEKIEGEFVALIGTPVPAVIGTDYKALKRMIEAKTGIPAMAFDTNGVRLYDDGSEKAWLALFETFTEMSMGPEMGRLGVIGATPFDADPEGFVVEGELGRTFGRYLPGAGLWDPEIFCYGMGAGIDEIRNAASVSKNLVVAPAGLKAARYLARRFGTPYEVGYPLEQIKGYDIFLKEMKEVIEKENPKKILIAHQQVLAHSLRQELRKYTGAQIVQGNWFMMDKELREPWDIPLTEEDQWMELIAEGDYDVIIADPLLKSAIPDYEGKFFCLNHFAISGKMLEFVQNLGNGSER